MHMAKHHLKRLLAAFVCTVCLLIFASAPAQAYELPRVHITADVQPNGDLIVSEKRTFSFDEDVNGMFWSIPFAENQQDGSSSITIDSVSVAGDAYWLGSKPTEFEWVDDASNGDRGVYTVENYGEGIELKVFMPQEEDDEATVTLRYTLQGAVMAWADTAELYWQFVGPEWEEPASDVELEVTFAGAPMGTPAITGTDDATLRAWGHGPLEGMVELNTDADNPTVVLEVPYLEAEQFAEVRATFPLDWVPNLQATDDARLETVLDEERAWAEEANARREHARMVASIGTAAIVAVSGLVFAATVILRFTKYRNPKPVFEETYFRDVPSDDHPAVLSALMANGAVKDSAFIATLMKLTDDRVVELVRETRKEKKLLRGEREVTDYALRLLNKEGATDSIDRIVLDSYFGKYAKDGSVISFDNAFSDEMLAGIENPAVVFKQEVTAQLEARSLTNLVPVAFKVVPAFFAIFIFVGGATLFAMTDDTYVVPIFGSILLSIIAAVIALKTKCYTQEAVELRNRCVALKRWLEDFTRLNEAVPGDLILWNKLLVMAVAFGVSEDVVRELADAVPREACIDDDGRYYYPSYYWYYSYGDLHSPMNKLSDSYSTSMRSLMLSSDSSGGGFGGGFSGGGGGGVGGGGGGTF